jgi:hypothetical protein
MGVEYQAWETEQDEQLEGLASFKKLHAHSPHLTIPSLQSTTSKVPMPRIRGTPDGAVNSAGGDISHFQGSSDSDGPAAMRRSDTFGANPVHISSKLT